MTAKQTRAKAKIERGRSVGTGVSTAGAGASTEAKYTPVGSGTFDLPRHLYYEPRCAICKHPERRGIEQMLAEGTAFRGISRALEEAGEAGVSVASLSRHLNQHMPSSVSVELAVLAEANNQTIEDIVERGVTITPYGLASKVMRMGFADIVSGRLRPSVKDMMGAAELVHKIEADTESDAGQVAMLADAYRSIYELARSFIPPEDQAAFAAELDRRSPIMQAVNARLSQEQRMAELEAWENDDIEDAEVLDDDEDSQ